MQSQTSLDGTYAYERDFQANEISETSSGTS